MKVIKTKALKVTQNATDVFLANLSVRQLLRICTIDEWDPKKDESDKNQGYQCETSHNRIKKVARYIRQERDALLPTTVLLNSRKKLSFIGDGNNHGLLVIKKEDLPLWLIDGQHRIKGLEHAVVKEGSNELLDFQLPVAITNNIDRNTEIKHFYTINRQHQRVNTRLAEQLLYDIYAKDSDFAQTELGKNQWKINAMEIVKRLNNDEKSPWYSRVRKPNEPRNSTNVASQDQLTASLHIINDKIFAGEDNDFKFGLLKNYWSALKELMPEAFKNPRGYVIQKTAGFFSLHDLLINVAFLCKGDYSIKNIKRILSSDSEHFQNSDFWKSGQNTIGTAASFTGRKGFNLLYQMLIDSIYEGLND